MNPFVNNPFVEPQTSQTSQTQQQAEQQQQQQQQQAKPSLLRRLSQTSEDSLSKVGEEVDDTMKNLRKTFAGIFGDM